MRYSKPYFRVFMPPKVRGNSYNYLSDDRNCKERIELIRFASLLETELKTLLEYIEPRKENLQTFSLRTYDMLIRTCVEIENNFKGILFANDYEKTNIFRVNSSKIFRLTIKDDYFLANSFLNLNEYSVEIAVNSMALTFSPFRNWSTDTYEPLDWYQAYNSVKHNRTSMFKMATLENVLKGIAALQILLFSQFGPYSSCIHTHGSLSGMSFTDDKGTITNLVDPSNSIIALSKIPDYYSEDRVYDFDWEILKETPDPFERVKIR